jgi:hypothetical protein
MDNCWVGLFELSQGSVEELIMDGGGIFNVRVPPMYAGNPVTGTVYFRGVWLPASYHHHADSSRGPQPWSNMRAHMQAIGNADATALFRHAEMASETTEMGVAARTISRLYRWSSSYGDNIGRPIVFLMCITIIFASFYWYWGGAVPSPDCRQLVWAKKLCEFDDRGSVYRSLWLAMQPFFNPFGLRSDLAVVPAAGWAMAVNIFQRILTILLVFVFLLAVRRRFRIA